MEEAFKIRPNARYEGKMSIAGQHVEYLVEEISITLAAMQRRAREANNRDDETGVRNVVIELERIDSAGLAACRRLNERLRGVLSAA